MFRAARAPRARVAPSHSPSSTASSSARLILRGHQKTARELEARRERTARTAMQKYERADERGIDKLVAQARREIAAEDHASRRVESKR